MINKLWEGLRYFIVAFTGYPYIVFVFLLLRKIFLLEAGESHKMLI